MVGLGQSFRWIARAVKTILHIGLLCFYEIMSLQRNVGSQPSNCHFRPVWDLDFWMPKHFQPCIVRDRHGYHRVRKHRINYNAFISDSYRRILTMVTTKNRLRSLFREEREKWGLNRTSAPLVGRSLLESCITLSSLVYHCYSLFRLYFNRQTAIAHHESAEKHRYPKHP